MDESSNERTEGRRKKGVTEEDATLHTQTREVGVSSRIISIWNCIYTIYIIYHLEYYILYILNTVVLKAVNATVHDGGTDVIKVHEHN